MHSAYEHDSSTRQTVASEMKKKQTKKKTTFPSDAEITALALFLSIISAAPHITIRRSPQNFPCATPATLCDDVNHPTNPGPIWQLPTL